MKMRAGNFLGVCALTGIAAGIAAILESEGKRCRLVECTDRWLEDHDWSLLAARLQGMVTGILATLRTNI